MINQSLKFAGNKCDPEPCENGAKCIRDNKRMDGYRCKCTSDFTGRNCQGNELSCRLLTETRLRGIIVVTFAEKKKSSSRWWIQPSWFPVDTSRIWNCYCCISTETIAAFKTLKKVSFVEFFNKKNMCLSPPAKESPTFFIIGHYLLC